MGDEMTLVLVRARTDLAQVGMEVKIDWDCLEKQAISYRVAAYPEW